MSPSAKLPTPPRAVAVVDDEPSVRVSLCRLCEALGFAATAYASGPEFIASLERRAVGGSGGGPDCLLLDAHMPDMTGLEVQEQLVNRRVRFPTIIITADDAPEAEARYRAVGVAAYLQKPVACDDLVAAIEEALRSVVSPKATSRRRPAG